MPARRLRATNCASAASLGCPGLFVFSRCFGRFLGLDHLGLDRVDEVGVDRVDDEVNYLYDPLHPAVLRLIKMTIDAGKQAGIPVAMCGEMAGDARYTRLLLGMGLTDFSMHHTALQEVKRLDHRPTPDQQQALAESWTPWRSVAARILWARRKAGRAYKLYHIIARR